MTCIIMIIPCLLVIILFDLAFILKINKIHKEGNFFIGFYIG
jgi:hypothetical protein